MANRMKKLVAWILTLSMCFSAILLPTAAAESGNPSDSNTIITEITDGDGNVIGTLTTTTTQSEVPGTSTTITDSSWNSQTTTGEEPSTSQNGNTTVESSSTVVTDVDGSETKTDSIQTNGDVQTYSGSTTGSETTTITDTTTVVTTTTGDLQSDVTEGPTTVKDGEVQEGEWSELEKTGEGQWEANPNGDTDGSYTLIPGTSSTSTETSDIDVDSDPLNSKDAVLDLTPGNQDSATFYITIEDALANDISYTEGEQADGSVVTFQRDGSGNVIGYTITRKVQNNGTPGQIQEGEAGEPVKNGQEIKTYIKPEGYTPGTVTSEDGTVTTTEEITDDNGNVIGYRITEVSVQTGPTASSPSTENGNPAPSVRTLPNRPVAPAPVTDRYGMTTTVVVEDIIENGEVVGYKTTTTVSDSDGNVASTESNSIYGTVTNYSSTVEKDPETDVCTTTRVTTVYGILTTQEYTITTPGTQLTENTRDVTEDIYQLVETEDGLFFLYQGRMYAVQAIAGHGDMEMESLKPNISGLTPGSYDGYVSSTTLLRNPENFNAGNTISSGYELTYEGYGLETAIRVNKNYKTDAGEVLAHQFMLVDRNGNKHYVLCADLGTNAVRGADYNMINVDSADYYVRSGAAEKIEAIALSGYWGTTSGVGSLDAVKAFLKANSNLSQAQIDALKPGEALTATQAAIWYYGNSDESKTMASDAITGKVYNSNGSLRSATADEANRINALYQALIGVDPDKVTNNTTEFLNKDNFATETQLVIKEKATNTDGSVKTDSKGNEKYVTDLSFSLDVEKSDLTGNLKIKVTDQYGNVLHTADLKTDSSNLVGRILADGSASSTYTIKNLELAEGVKITLNLSGTQELEEGVYLYSAAVYSDSQTFVGVASGERDVNLSVDMKFDVTDPQAQIQHTTNTWTEKSTDQDSYTKTDNYKQEKTGTETSETITVNTKTYGTTVQTDVTTKVTKEHREWNSAYEYQLTVTRDDDGDDLDEIDDEDVPLADAPKTGDVTLILAVVSLFSAGGLVVLNRKPTEEE